MLSKIIKFFKRPAADVTEDAAPADDVIESPPPAKKSKYEPEKLPELEEDRWPKLLLLRDRDDRVFWRAQEHIIDNNVKNLLDLEKLCTYVKQTYTHLNAPQEAFEFLDSFYNRNRENLIVRSWNMTNKLVDLHDYSLKKEMEGKKEEKEEKEEEEKEEEEDELLSEQEF